MQSETDESLVSYDVDMRKFEMINTAYFYKVSSFHKPLTQRQISQGNAETIGLNSF